MANILTDKIYTLVQDNGSCNGNVKRSVQVSESVLVYELKKFFKWRKDVTVDRLYRQGSHDYDRFIKYLSEK